MRKNLYQREYYDFAMKPSEVIDDFFARFEKILSNLRGINIISTGEDNATKILRSLGSKWLMVVTTINIDTLTMDDLFSRLKTYEIETFPSKIDKLSSLALITNSV